MEGRLAIHMKDNLMKLIKQMEMDILMEWSKEASDVIHASTSKYLLSKTEKGLIATNFDENVSIFHQFCRIKLVTSLLQSSFENPVQMYNDNWFNTPRHVIHIHFTINVLVCYCRWNSLDLSLINPEQIDRDTWQ